MNGWMDNGWLDDGEMELKVYEGTLQLAKIPEDDRGREVQIESNKLGFQQRKISLEADKVLTLLLEEGSSIAFPETVKIMIEDMDQVSDRLSQTKVDRLTVSIEEDIIQSIEEMIEALQAAQQELMDQQQQQQQQQQQRQQQEKPLVDQLSELRMIRSLQLRINKRTQRYSRLLDDIDDPTGQAKDTDLVEALQKLGQTQRDLQRITRDIVLGKNQ